MNLRKDVPWKLIQICFGSRISGQSKHVLEIRAAATLTDKISRAHFIYAIPHLLQIYTNLIQFYIIK